MKNKMINVFQPELGKEELKAIEKVFESNWLGKGNVTQKFENHFSNHLNTNDKNIKSISCCTEGLFQSMELLDIGSGDEVILPSISFIAAGSAILKSGAKPIFCDVDKNTLNPSSEHIEAKITKSTKAVIILHYGGLPAPMKEIIDLVKSKKIFLIEDSACSVASTYDNKACGTFGDIGIWSFDAMKILVTGDGGMMFFKDKKLAKRAENFLYLGLVSKSGLERTDIVDEKWWEYDISYPGRRAIINDITSAMGLVQLSKLKGFINRRKEIHETYNKELQNLDTILLPPEIPANCKSSYYFYWIQTTEIGIRDKLAFYLRQKGIYTTFRYYPLHRVEYFGSISNLPNTDHASDRTLCIPMHQSLDDAEVNKIIECIYSFFTNEV